jgi:hypothetical protein
LEEHFWLVEKLENPQNNINYRAIDCNHRMMAYKSLGIKTARALVFQHLDEETYNLIAGKNYL